MASNYWIKLYHEILDDPKMGRLRDRLWRRAIECFLLAGEHDEGGYLPPLEDLAWRLRADMEQLETEFGDLAACGILEQRNGGWFVTKFAERQSPMTAAERMRRMRERKRKQDYYEDATEKERGRYGAVTKRHTDIDTDKDKDIDTEEIARVNPSVSAFCDYAKRPQPDLKRAKRRHWVEPGLLIVETAGGDPEAAAELTKATMAYMDARGLSYSNLGSLVNVARTVRAGAEASPNGHGGYEIELQDSVDGYGGTF